MGLREMQDMETQLMVRGGGRHDVRPVECCRECAEKNRRLETQMAKLPREDNGVIPYRSRWDRVMPWLQVAAVWGVMAWLFMYAPQQCHQFSAWVSGQ